jgi:arginyl-tRNA synthetase
VTPAALADLVRVTAVDVLTSRELDSTAVPPVVTVERPRNPAHGDYATSLALQVAKKVGVGPRDLAGWLAEALTTRDGVAGAEVAGPGFVNLRLAAGARADIVRQVLAAGPTNGQHLGPITGATPPRQIKHWAAVRDVQYAHARLSALLRNAADLGLAASTADLHLLTHQREGDLIRVIGDFTGVVATAEPHRVARYLEELSATFLTFQDTCRVLPQGDEEPTPLTGARLALCAATRQVLADGLGMLDVPAPERM